MRYLTARQERNRRTIRTSVIVVAVYLVSNVPLVIVWLAYFWFTHEKTHEATVWAFNINISGVVTANPFIYAFSDKTILAGYKKILRKLVGFCRRRKARFPNEENIEMN